MPLSLAATALAPLRDREPGQAGALDDPVHPRSADLDVVVAPQAYRDPRRAEVVTAVAP
jgi:hypothetical protein